MPNYFRTDNRGVTVNEPPKPKREDWMSPLNKIIWMDAFKKRKTEVMIRDGRKFSISYDEPPFVLKTTGEVRKVALVQPTDGTTAPYGFFNLAVVTKVEWLKETKNVKG